MTPTDLIGLCLTVAVQLSIIGATVWVVWRRRG